MLYPGSGQLEVNDLTDGLDSPDTKYELLVSADVLPFTGDLTPFFERVGKYSHQDSLCIFSTEHTDADEYILQETGRYAHSKIYVLSRASSGAEQLK
jgi:predicted TPR repeat methyltransferase